MKTTNFKEGDLVIATGKNKYPNGVLCTITQVMIPNKMFRCVVSKNILNDDIGARTIGPFTSNELKHATKAEKLKAKVRPKRTETVVEPEPEKVEEVVEPEKPKIMSSKKRKKMKAQGFFE